MQNNERSDMFQGKVAVYYDSFSAPEIVHYREYNNTFKQNRGVQSYAPAQFDTFISIGKLRSTKKYNCKLL